MPVVSDVLQRRVQSCKFQIKLDAVWVQAMPTSSFISLNLLTVSKQEGELDNIEIMKQYLKDKGEL